MQIFRKEELLGNEGVRKERARGEEVEWKLHVKRLFPLSGERLSQIGCKDGGPKSRAAGFKWAATARC